MADTTFAPGTVIKADWLQDVNDVVYGGGISSDAVTGPASSNNDELVLFDGTTGKTIKQGGILIDSMVTVNGTQVVSNKTFNSSCVWASVIQETNGGTGINAYTTGDIIYSPATNHLMTLPVGSEGEVLTVTSGLPSWQTPGVGGSDLETGSVVGDILYSNATNSLAKLPIGVSGETLTVSAGGIPEWNTPTATLNAPYYIDQAAIGSNITYYDGQTAVATYPHNGYQNVLRAVRGSADYTGTPTTYTHLGQLDANTVAYKTSAGYQQYLTTDSGGRTLSSAYKARVEHNTYGDVNGFFATVSVNGHANMAGISGNWTGAPSGTVCGGEVYANAAKTNLYGQEFQLYSNSKDNTTAFGAVYGLYRDNTVASYNNVWVGVRAQSNGASYSDVGFQVANNFKVGFDASSITLDANKAAFTMPVGGRFYLGTPATTWPAIMPTLTGAYIDTENTKIRGSVPFGVVSTQAHLLKLDAGDSALHEVDGTTGAVKVNIDGDLRYIPYSSTPTGATGGSTNGLLNVRDYGATGDGATNDTTAIQNCINDCFATGANMLVPAGTYLVTALTMSSDIYAKHFSIFGEGRNKTIIRKYATSSAVVLTIGDSTPAIFQANITIEGITFDGLNTTTAATVRSYDMVRSSFKDCTFYRGAITYESYGAVANQFYNCMFDAGNIGVKLTWASGVASTPNETLFNGCQFVNNPLWGLYMEHGALCVLDSCEIEGNGTSGNSSSGGVYVTNIESFNPSLVNSIALIAQNCWCEANAGRATFSFNDGRNTVENCYFIANPNSTYDIYVSGGTYKASNLTFINAKTYNVYETSGVTSGNLVTDLSGSGFTPTVNLAAGDKTVRDYGGIQTGYNATAADGTATITFPRPYPTGTQPVVICTIIANTTGSITTAEIHTITNTGFSIRTKAYTGGGGAVIGATKEFFWMAAHNG